MKVPAQYIARALEMFYNSRQIRDIRQDIKTNFSYYPSDSVVRLWIKKYSQSAKKYFENYRPMVSNSWMAVETFYHLRGNFRVMMHDVLDMKTRFVLCSQIATTHNNESLLNAIREASSKAGKIPEILITNQFASLEKAIDSVNEFRNISIQDLPAIGTDNPDYRERLGMISRSGEKVIRVFNNFDWLVNYLDGWIITYNFFNRLQILNGKTPAETAHIEYPVKSWADFIKCTN